MGWYFCPHEGPHIPPTRGRCTATTKLVPRSSTPGTQGLHCPTLLKWDILRQCACQTPARLTPLYFIPSIRWHQSGAPGMRSGRCSPGMLLILIQPRKQGWTPRPHPTPPAVKSPKCEHPHAALLLQNGQVDKHGAHGHTKLGRAQRPPSPP